MSSSSERMIWVKEAAEGAAINVSFRVPVATNALWMI
jgi:hypothetical protein